MSTVVVECLAGAEDNSSAEARDREPPRLLPLPDAGQFSSEWTWFGALDRFELVKSARRTVNRGGRELTDAELTILVEQHERVERLLVEGSFPEAAGVLGDLCAGFPNSTLGLFNLALAKLAAAAAGGERALTPALEDAAQLLRMAVGLEPENQALRSHADLVLRVSCREPVAEQEFEGAAGCSRSSGMLSALHHIALAGHHHHHHPPAM
jgi:hypothetical protein